MFYTFCLHVNLNFSSACIWWDFFYHGLGSWQRAACKYCSNILGLQHLSIGEFFHIALRVYSIILCVHLLENRLALFKYLFSILCLDIEKWIKTIVKFEQTAKEPWNIDEWNGLQRTPLIPQHTRACVNMYICIFF